MLRAAKADVPYPVRSEKTEKPDPQVAILLQGGGLPLPEPIEVDRLGSLVKGLDVGTLVVDQPCDRRVWERPDQVPSSDLGRLDAKP